MKQFYLFDEFRNRDDGPDIIEYMQEFKRIHDGDIRWRTMVPSLQQLEDVMYKAEQISEERYEDYGFMRGGMFTMTCLIYSFMLVEIYRKKCKYGYTNDKTPRVKPRQRPRLGK